MKNNHIVLHHCNACDKTWEAEKETKICPGCNYKAPRIPSHSMRIIETTKVNINSDGRIICHLVDRK